MQTSDKWKRNNNKAEGHDPSKGTNVASCSITILDEFLHVERSLDLEEGCTNIPRKTATRENCDGGKNNTISNSKSFPEASQSITDIPLFKAISHGQTECVKVLLQENASIESIAPQKYNVFHLAAKLGHHDILKILLDHDGAFTENNINALTTDKLNFGPIHFAVENNHIDCVKHLLDKNAEIRLKTNNGSTPLHIAARKNNLKLAKFLLESDPEAVHQVDNLRWSPLHIAISNGSRDFVRFLILNNADLTACTKNNHKTAIKMIMESIIKPTEFLESVFDESISTERSKQNLENELENYVLEFHDTNDIKVDYSILLPYSVTQNTYVNLTVIESILATGDSFDQKRLLIHPMVESFLCLKWKAFLPLFYCVLINYSTFVLTLTIFVMTHFGYTDSGMEKPLIWNRTFWTISLYLSIAAVFYQELSFLCVNLKQYLLDKETFAKFVIFTMALILPTLIERIPCPRAPAADWARHVATIAILLSWVYLTCLLSRFPWGYYVSMFFRVCVNVLKILSTFACLMIGFALSFMIMLHHQTSFENFEAAIVKTMVMMTSEFDYSDLVADKNVTQHIGSLGVIRLVFFIFLILAAIVLMNLMIGVSVNDINELKRYGRIMQLEKQVNIISSLDRSLECWSFKLFNRVLVGPDPPDYMVSKILKKIVLERCLIKPCLNYYAKLLNRMQVNASKILILKPYEPMCKSNKAIPNRVRDAIYKKAALQNKTHRTAQQADSGEVNKQSDKTHEHDINLKSKIPDNQTNYKSLRKESDETYEHGLECLKKQLDHLNTKVELITSLLMKIKRKDP